jgi:TetR/AcrR family transcriptional regulator, mexJK operon transcriptional repressor
MDAAARVFMRHGYTDTSIDAIAAEARVSKQTIYNHFADKEHLFRAVIRATLASAGAKLDAPLDNTLADSEDLDRDLRALGRRLVRAALQEDVAALRRLLIAELDRHPELLEEFASTGRELARALTRAIEQQTERGALDVPDATRAANQLILLLATEALTRARYGLRALSDAEREEIVNDGVEMWLRAYRTRPTP